mgnify:FL=1
MRHFRGKVTYGIHSSDTPRIHAEVLEVQVVCRNWSELEHWLIERYKLDDSLQMLKELMEWVQLTKMGRNRSTLS